MVKFSEIVKNAFSYILKPFKSDSITALTLLNGLEVLVLRNEKFESSSINLYLDIGNSHSPFSTPGLAHLFEHLICLGSDDSVATNELMIFSKSRLGKFSALTAEETMKFSLKFKKIENLITASKILCRAIVNPVKDKNLVAGEIKVIHQEFMQTKSNELYRVFSLLQKSMNEESPESQFLIGNRASLDKPDIIEQLAKFHELYFTADHMKLIISTNKSIQEISELLKSFEIIKKSDLKSQHEITPALVSFRDGYSGSIVNYESLSESSNLFIFIFLPSVLRHTRNRLVEYLNLLLTSEENFSLDQKFKDKISDMSFSATSLSWCLRLNFSLNLTKEGLVSINEIMKGFQSFILNHKPDLTIFNLVSERTKKTIFSSEDSSTMVDFYAEPLMQNWKEDFLGFHYDCIYDENLIKIYLKEIGDVKNWIVFRGIKHGDFPNVEEWYSVRHSNPQPIHLMSNAN